jgi:UDP-3-O-[3-hydroxymyristoyl] glucosamine N-acyltransferase
MLLSEIAIKLQAGLIGDGQRDITSVNTIADASSNEICFLT